MRQSVFIGFAVLAGIMMTEAPIRTTPQPDGLLASPPAQGDPMIRRINPPGSTQPTTYTHLVRAGKTLYIAGQVASDDKGEVVAKGDMRAQIARVYENLKRILASQGATFANLVKVTIFTVDIDEFRKHGDVRRRYTDGHPPAGTLVQIDRLASPDYLVEVEAVAVLD